MAVTGVNNYSNIYTNAYTGNIRKNNAKETTEKQVVEQTEDVKTGITRKTAADELSVASTDSLVTLSRIPVSNACPGFQFGLADFTAAYIAALYCPSYCSKVHVPLKRLQ